MTDWLNWLRQYDEPRSPLANRLAVVQRIVDRELARSAPRQASVFSMCAGDGRDILDVLAARPDASRVRVTLVEIDPYLCMMAKARARRHGLRHVEVLRRDAGLTDSYLGSDPADVVIAMGMFGNMSDDDMSRTIGALPALCRRDGLVVWGRRNDREAIALARRRFEEEAFVETATSRSNAVFHVGAHRLARDPPPKHPGRRFFEFNNGGAGGCAL